MSRMIISDMTYKNLEGNMERELMIGYYNISHGETLRYTLVNGKVLKEFLDWIKIKEEIYRM